MEQQISFASQLKRARAQKNFSQAELAERLGIDTKTVNRWEVGKSLPRPFYRRKLIKIFGEQVGKWQISEGPSKNDGPPASVELGDAVEKESEEASSEAEEVREVYLSKHILREDLIEAPSDEECYGREPEEETLEQWIIADRCRIVAVLGIGGNGKSTLTARVVRKVKPEFEYVFWRSLQNAPPLEHILKQSIQFISGQQRTELPERLEDRISLLMSYLHDHRCLLILDNVESILKPGKRVGQYREGYEDYGKLMQSVRDGEHQSCLLLTSREKLKELVGAGKGAATRVWTLPGLNASEGQKILTSKSLLGTDKIYEELVKLYAGNPLALKIVSEYIQELFDGEIERFLQEKEFAIGDVHDLLEEQFRRLSEQEKEVLYWLAIEREAVSIEQVLDNLVSSAPRRLGIEAFESLKRRFLIEARGGALFTLQPVIMEYVTNELVEQANEEFLQDKTAIWSQYAFIKAKSIDYVRESQTRVILASLAKRLITRMRKEGLRQRLLVMLDRERSTMQDPNNYLAGNAFNLLLYLGYNLRGLDFSGLTIRQAYLQNALLPGVNFTNANFMDSVFMNTFGNVLSVAFSPSSEYLATGTANGEIWIYEAKSGTPIATYRGHTDGVWSLAFSPDGEMLVSSSDDRTVCLWNAKTGEAYKTFTDHQDRVRAVAFHPEKDLFASGSDDQTVRMWDASTGSCIRILQGHRARVWAAEFSPDGKLLATGSVDKTVVLWDSATGEQVGIMEGHKDAIRSLSFNSNGTLLATGSDDQTIRIWDVETHSLLKELRGHTNCVWSVTFHPDENIVISGSEDQTILCWNAETGERLWILEDHSSGVRSVHVSDNGRLLASGADDQTARLWDVETRRSTHTLQGYTSRIWSVVFDAKGDRLISSHDDQRIRVWNTTDGTCSRITPPSTHRARCAVISPDGERIASGGEDHTVRLWDAHSGRSLRVFSEHGDWIRTLAFSPDGKCIASGGEDNTVLVWDSHTGATLQRLGHGSWVRSVAFSADGQLLATGGDDRLVRLWNVKTGKELYVLPGHQGHIRAVAFGPGDRILASGGEDQKVHIWSVEDGTHLQTLSHKNWVLALAFDANDGILASGGDDPAIHLWNIQSSREVSVLRKHSQRVRTLSFHPEGNVLASGSDDGTILLWDTAREELMKELIDERPYEGMQISGVTGLTDAQRISLKLLGAVDQHSQQSHE